MTNMARETQEVFVLGAEDIEMKIIEELLAFLGKPFVHALSPTGARANAREAAQGQWQLPDSVPPDTRLVLIELNPQPVMGRDVLAIDHHSQQDPPFPSLYQVATHILLGERGLILGACDHDLARAYSWFPAEKVLKCRAEALGVPLEEAIAYCDALLPTRFPQVLLGMEKSPNPLVGDVLISRSQSAVVNVGPFDGTVKFTVVGETNADLVEKILQPFRDAGFETYSTRGIGGVYLPSADVAAQILGVG